MKGWHTSWAELLRDAPKEWFSWLGAAICAGALGSTLFFTQAELTEYGGRVLQAGGIAAGLILILKRAKQPDGEA
jgi:hypothetical protein